MRVAILASGAGWHVQDLTRAARNLGHIVEPISFRRLEGWITGGLPVRARLAAPPQTTRFSVLRTPSSVHSTEYSKPSLPEISNEAEPISIDLSRTDCVLVRTMPAGSLEQVIFRMDVLHRLLAGGVPVFNPPRALETAVDKYLACFRMEAVGLPVPPTVACEGFEAALEAFERLGGDVVVKPLFGSEGKGLTRVNDPDVAYRVFRTLERLGSVLYLQKFIVHEGYDVRAFVLGDRVLAAMRRRHDSDWRTNVARGAKGERVELLASETELALRAAKAIGAGIAGVDLLPGRDGHTYALEVNAVPGWRALAKVTEVDVADQVMRFIAQKCCGGD